MTPIIDIVFLLIIFFLVVCRFIEAENFPVNVPTGCDFAEKNDAPGLQITTVTLLDKPDDMHGFAVGAQKIRGESFRRIIENLIEEINARISSLGTGEKIVTLRIDKGVEWRRAQYVLAAVAGSTAEKIRLSVIRHNPDAGN